MYVVTGATGNTGKVVAETLLAQKKPVRVYVRDAAKAAGLKEKGAEVVVGSLDDGAAVAGALRGATAAFLMQPPDMRSTDALAKNRALTDLYVRAIGESGLGHVVFLSSIGAQHAEGTGIIKALHYGEEKLFATSAHVTAIRASNFMENWGGMLHPVTHDGVLPAFFDTDKKFPMVATRDIGEISAKYLLDAGPRRRIVELAGPVEYSTRDVAATFGKLLHKTVTVVDVPREAQIPALTGAGFSEDMARLFVELDRGIDSGAVAFEGQGAIHERGKVTLEQVLGSFTGAR